MTALQVSQAFALGGGLVGILVWGMYATTHRRYWPFAVPPISWLVHVVLFYGMVLARDFYGYLFGFSFTYWSALLRLHAVLLLIGIGLLMGLDRVIVNERWMQG